MAIREKKLNAQVTFSTLSPTIPFFYFISVFWTIMLIIENSFYVSLKYLVI